MSNTSWTCPVCHNDANVVLLDDETEGGHGVVLYWEHVQ